ncbi:MAG: PrsW family glutamic-type intramembrane protease [Candidatus Peregrinibacteria bacterium]
MKFLLPILFTVIPIALWGIYFYDKNPRRQPIPEIIKIFLMGLFSIVPVILFHQYFLGFLTNQLATALGIEPFSIVISILELVLLVLFILFFILLFALIQSSILKTLYHLPWWNNFKTVAQKLYHLTPLLIFFVLFLVIELAFNFTLKTDFILSLAGSTIIFAVLEEYFKYIINPFLVYKRLNTVGSAIVNALYIGLAFAFVENILFFVNNWTNPDLTFIFVYRSLFTTLLHVCASGLLGYFYGLSLFAKPIVANYEIEKSQYSTLTSLRALLGVRKKSIFQSVSVTQGFFVAAMVHALFNLLLYLDFKVIAAIGIVAFSGLIVYLLNLKSSNIQYGLVGTATMPEEDFENLRLQVSVLQHVQEIQKQNP